jgi:exonuclease VII small subunit
MHHDFHKLGDEIVAAIRANDRDKAEEIYKNAEQISKRMLATLQSVEKSIEDLDKRGISVFGK